MRAIGASNPDYCPHCGAYAKRCATNEETPKCGVTGKSYATQPTPEKETSKVKTDVGRCGSCRYWEPCPTSVPGLCAPEKICGRSRLVCASKGMYGQDGRAVITRAGFGCIHYSDNSVSHENVTDRSFGVKPEENPAIREHE